MIYFAEAVGLDRVKIGTSRDVPRRLKALATLCPCPVRLLRTIEGWLDDERALHALFAAHRSHGEWFVLSAIAARIERLPDSPRPSDYLRIERVRPLPPRKWWEPITPTEHETMLREMGLHG